MALNKMILVCVAMLALLLGLQPHLCVGALPPPHHSPQQLAECSALEQLLAAAGPSALSTNCNCTASQLIMISSEARSYRRCARTRQHFAGCTGAGFRTVSELHLSNMSLEGNLTWVANFKHLECLDVSLNRLSGAIPSEIMWSLGKLVHVNLSHNSLSGHIPNLINGSASSNSPLRALDFSHNQIEGPLPPHLCTRFPNLTHLVLSSNSLNGSANLSLCHRLETLDASLNSLQGPLLEHLQAKTSLKTISLQHNNLNGSIPSFSSLPRLADLDVSFNHLSGKFGSENYSFPSNLAKLNVSHNKLEVVISTTMIHRFNISSFWPNSACEGSCLFHSAAPSPSPLPSPSVSVSAASPPPMLSQKENDYSITHRLDGVLGIIGGCLAGFILITIISCIIVQKRGRKSSWPLYPKRPVPPFKHVPEVGPFSFEAQSGTWVADVKDPSSVPVVIFEKPLMNLTFSDLLQATNSFDREYEVGDGTGLVYACVLPGVLEDDAKVTIEVVEDGSSLSTEAAHAAFTAMGEIKHDNLVPLLGYCIVGEEKLLIYKHMEGGSLEDVLHAMPEEAQLSNASVISIDDWNNIESWPDDNDLQSRALDTSKQTMDWETRHKIALGVARALAYLHNGCRRPVVHGAVSSSCILLDKSLKEAMVVKYGGAWGLWRQLTPGYVAPECKESAHITASHSSRGESGHTSNGDVYAHTSKCDVYGVGVVLLELATGQHAVGNYGGSSTLVAWVRALKKGKRAEEAVDPRLPAPAHPYLLEMIKVGCLCTADSPSKRPSMQQVVGLLKDLGTH